MDDTGEEEFFGTSSLRGVLLLAGVVTVGFYAWKIWKKQKAGEVVSAPRTIRVPIELPNPNKRKT